MLQPCTILILYFVYVGSTYIGLTGILLCSEPFSRTATIFLMERDFGRTIFDYVDDDDVLAYKQVEVNSPFELGGYENELNGLEPYIYIRYNCDKGYREEVINLGDTQFRDRVFYFRKHLDTGATVLL
ncbi:hypothetical protein RB195_026292 [Necator americanus]|uniref:Uncharacterized protein n=1 Tax=Necator americanus TaxID=51031 RepID=A0ABR1EYN1_NECAM